MQLVNFRRRRIPIREGCKTVSGANVPLSRFFERALQCDIVVQRDDYGIGIDLLPGKAVIGGLPGAALFSPIEELAQGHYQVAAQILRIEPFCLRVGISIIVAVKSARCNRGKCPWGPAGRSWAASA